MGLLYLKIYLYVFVTLQWNSNIRRFHFNIFPEGDTNIDRIVKRSWCKVDNCDRCNYLNSALCETCHNGYDRTTTGQCHSSWCNVDNCASCSFWEFCGHCNKGFHVNNGLCHGRLLHILVSIELCTANFKCALSVFEE